MKPTEPVTRGEMAKIIAISHKMTNKTSVLKFSDLPSTHKYYDYVNMIVNYGLVSGYPDGTIRPDGLITRAEYITMINKFIGRDDRYYVDGLPSLYKDLLPSHWAFEGIQRSSFGFTTELDINGYFQVDPAKKISKLEFDK
ncbi:MAG TPA: S-layer homology domain-containing protein [Bacilli bacterium]